MYHPEEQDRKILLALIIGSFLCFLFLVLQINFAPPARNVDKSFLENGEGSCIDIVTCKKIVVKYGQDITEIAEEYNISPDTVVSANQDIIKDANSKIVMGDQLRIPDISGVYYTIQTDDTIQLILEKHQIEFTEANQKNFLQTNGLKEENIKEGVRVFVPEGKLISNVEM